MRCTSKVGRLPEVGISCACFCALLLHAARASSEERWTPTIEVVTTAPLDVAERVSLEAPGRLHLRSSVGVMPGPYAGLINNAIVALGGFSDSEAEVVHQVLDRSLVLRLQGGFRPFEQLGLYFDVGYALLSLSGDLSGNEVLLLGRGAIPPQDATSSLRHYEVSSKLHLVVLEIGWEQPIFDWLFMRGALGFAGTQAAHSRIEPLFPSPDAEFLQLYCDEAAKYLDRLYKQYVYTPTITVGVGVQF
jgi:hypothetical protein